MKKIIPATALAFVLASCSTQKYIPVETVKTEYRDNFVRDSIVRYDSVFVRQQADTVYFERYRYLYKNRIVRDSVFIQDTIRVPFPVETVRQVKTPLSSWQNFQLWCGRALLALALLVGLYFLLKFKKILP